MIETDVRTLLNVIVPTVGTILVFFYVNSVIKLIEIELIWYLIIGVSLIFVSVKYLR